MEHKENDSSASSSPNLTKFPNAEQANKEAPAVNGLPSAFDLFKPSIDIIKSNLPAFLILLGIPIILSMVGQGPGLFKGGRATWGVGGDIGGGWLALGGIGGLMAILTAPGVLLLELNGTRKHILSTGQAFTQGLKIFWRLLGLYIVTAIILVASFVLLVVPFFLVLPRVFLASYFLVDRKMGIIEALKASNNAYKAHKGVWGLIGVTVLIGFAGVIPFVGTILSNALAFIYAPAAAIRYEQIRLLSEGKAPRTPIEVDPETTTAAA